LDDGPLDDDLVFFLDADMTDDQEPQSGSGTTMSKHDANQAPKGQPSGRLYGAVAAIAAVAGFLGMYMNLPPAGNEIAPTAPPAAKVDVTPARETPATTTDATERAVTGGLKAYAKGDMGTFVVKKTPVPVSDKLRFADFTTGNDGVTKTLADWKGKVVLLNLWATWCAPCRKEMPDLVKLDQELGGDDFDLLAISIDRGGPQKPRRFLEQINAQSLGLFQGPSAETSGPLKAFGMPTTLLIDREGRELGRLVGPADWSSEEAKALIKAAIAGAD